MATRPLFILIGQSNSSPTADFPAWRGLHGALNLDNVSRVAIGSYSDLFSLPAGWPVPFNTPINLKGRATRGFRYLDFYNPIVTGYTGFPHSGHVVDSSGGVANTATAFYVDIVFDTASAAARAVTVTRVSTGETRTITAVSVAGLVAGAGCRITLNTPFLLTPAVPAPGELFTYQIKAATASGGTASITITNAFGQLFAGFTDCLMGLKVTVGSQTLTILSWTNATKTLTFTTIPVPDIALGDVLTLAPVTGATFSKFGLWLPWTPLEADHTTNKEHPYPPGFDYASNYHTGYDYSPQAAPSSPFVTLGFISYHVGLGARLQEFLGEEVYLLPCDFASTSLYHRESLAAPAGYGWHDASQQSHWAPGKGNNCYARLLDEIDAGIAAAALEGDTLSCRGIFFVQGEDDGSLEDTALRYAENLSEFKLAVRNAIKARGLWAGDAKKIPWIQPEIYGGAGSLWAFHDILNTEIRQSASQDAYMRTFDMSDAPLRDGAHYNAEGATMLEERSFFAWADIVRSSDQLGVIDICNLALSLIGDSSGVISIDPLDGSAQAVHCARFFPLAFDETLKLRKWTFASRRVDLTQLTVTSTWAQWPFAYLVPSDYLRAIALLPPGVLDDNVVRQDNVFFDLGNTAAPFSGAPAPVPHSIEQDDEGRRILYTVQGLAVLRYIARVPVSACPQEFKTLVAWKLAELLSGAIIKGKEGSDQAERCKKMQLLALMPQDDSDADSRRVEAPHVPATLRGRG